MKHLITATELIKRMAEDEDLVIFDCRFNLVNQGYGKLAFSKEHVEGAYYIDPETDLTGPKGKHGGNHPFPDPVAFKVLLESHGVSDDTTIVIYDQGDFNGPARMLCLLNYIGFEHGYILDGGIQAYIDAGGKTEAGPSHPKTKVGNITLNVNKDFAVSIEYVKEKLYQDDTVLVDSRSYSRYLGTEEPLYREPGHIPSAKSYYYGDVLENASLKDKEFLQEHFKELEGKEIILSCGSGVSACVNGLALAQLDIPYKLYVGSYSDWLSYPENEIKTGDE